MIPEAYRVNYAKSKLILFFAALLLSGCAATRTDALNRGLAQIKGESELAQREKEFQELWASATPVKDFIGQVSRVESLYFRGQKFVYDFDAELNGDLNALNRSESYRRLQVIRGLQEEQAERLVFFYRRCIDMEQSGDPASVKKAGQILSAFGRYMLLNRNKINRLAMQNVIAALRAVRAEQKQKAAELEGIEFKSPEEITQFLDEKEQGLPRREALAAAAKKEAIQADREFDQAFSEAEKAEAKAAREPQSEITFFPNPGRSGNLMGNELPMGTYAITFDDGPSSDWTPKILQVLHDTDQKTTFFWLAKNLESRRMDQIVAVAKQEGHTLGNHSYTHADLSKPGADIQREVMDSTAVDKEVYGIKPSYFRCPYGSCIYKNTVKVREAIASQRMLHVTWTIDSLDWQDKDPASVVDRVLRQVKKNGRGIILFHDIHPQSYAASSYLLREYFAKNKDGAKLRTISQIVRELNSLPQFEPPAILKFLPWGKSE